MINLFNTVITTEAIDNAIITLNSKFISAGKQADELENIFLNDYSFLNPVTVNSGTSGLHLALLAAGIKEGDEVITPAQTFIATGLAILYCKAKPIFVDINPLTGNIDVNKIEEKITTKTKVILPVFWAGVCVDIDKINEIAKKYDLKIVNDTAHAMGALYKGSKVGSFSDFNCFSFQSIKHITGVDAGCVTTKNENDYLKLKKLRWFGIDRENDLPNLLGERVYNLKEIGYKYHMNDLSAALIKGNLIGFADRIKRLRDIAEYYFTELNNIQDDKNLKLMEYENIKEPSYWLFPLLVKRRNEFIIKLKKANIMTSVVHLGIDKNEIFGGVDKTLIGQRYFDDNQIHIPIHNNLSDNDVEHIVKTIKNGW